MTRQRATEPEGFSDFWNEWKPYQRKTDGRGKARPAYAQMIEAGHDPQDILDGTRWYLRNMSERDAPYIPLASSFLRSERWLDDCEREREFQARMQEKQAQASENVVSMPRTSLPANHFSRRWESGEFQKEQKRREA